jgi:hypothetical protein
MGAMRLIVEIHGGSPATYGVPRIHASSPRSTR